jgi:hypothetical protein
MACACSCLAAAAPLEFHVATNGDDAWSGTLSTPNASKTDGPWASLDGARTGVRRLRGASGLPTGGAQVSLQAGVYPLDGPLSLTREDSGTQEAPIAYRAAAGAEVRISGGRAISHFQAVTDATVLSRLDAAARDHVRVADLRTLGLTNHGTPDGGGAELFFNDEPMPLSRWPNTGFIHITEVLGKTPMDVRGTKGCVEGLFRFEGDRPKRWVAEPDAWVHGYWFWDWSDQRQRVKAIYAENGTLEIAPPYHNYGYRKGQWFYGFNLLCELDQPGEWYLDREKGRLYFWPPSPLPTGRAVVSVLPTLVTFDEVSCVTFRGLIFEAARETAIIMRGGTGNRILGCTLRNLGGSAISISGGSNHGVVGCDISQCGAGGVSLDGGDRKTLTAAGHFADNNHIHHYGRWRPMYSAGVSLNGVGNRATHNLIDNAPHQAIAFGGNDHRIEFNEIHSVCHESNDAGAIYAGRDWTMRGTVIRHNHLHDITGFEGRGCVGVYLDDMFCGTEISGNLFVRVTRAAFIGGGRDCTIANNVFVDCQPALHIDARAMGWAKYHADEWVKEGHEKGTLSGTRYRESPYRERYPKLPPILDEEPWAPRGNVVCRNLCLGGKWDEIEARAQSMVAFQDNLVGADPGFVDAAHANYELKPEAPALKLGFEPLPLAKIGLYADPNRASWPVKHTVRRANAAAPAP